MNIKKQAHEEGYKTVWKEGDKQGYAEYQAMLYKNAQEVDSRQQKKIIITYLESSEKTILDLATKDSRKNNRQQKLKMNQEYFLALVKRALKEVKELSRIQLHVHPIHYEFLIIKKKNL